MRREGRKGRREEEGRKEKYGEETRYHTGTFSTSNPGSDSVCDPSNVTDIGEVYCAVYSCTVLL